MNDAAQMWITAVPPFGPTGRGVLIGIDLESEDPGQRTIAALGSLGHEGEEGVFYLLPEDLSARFERTGDRLAVRVLAWPTAIDQALASHDEAFRAAVSALSSAGLVDGRVTLLRREIETDFSTESEQAVLLIETTGPATLPELFAAFEEGETAFLVLAAD